MDNEETQNMESEIKDLFGITSEIEPAPESAAEEGSETGVQDNTEQTTTQDTQETSESNTATAKPDEKTDEGNNTQPKNQEQDTTVDPEERFNKQNSAFAQMRIQNKELSDLLMKLANATGQNPKNLNEAKDILNGSINKVVAKNRNIPEDVLREMEEDKKALAEYKQEQAKQKALAGFQAVKDYFHLSKDEIYAFTDKLIEKNLNPYEQDLDLMKEYKNIYFEQLIEKAREEGVQAERARSLKAQQSSTTPPAQKGLPENTGSQAAPIKSIADLDKLLDSLK